MPGTDFAICYYNILETMFEHQWDKPKPHIAISL